MKAKLISLDPTGIEVELAEFELPIVLDNEPESMKVYRYLFEIGNHKYKINTSTGELSRNSNFNHDDRARQLISFEGLNIIRGILPTDIDAFIDFNQNLFIILEGKVKGTPMGFGQKKSFEAFCNMVSFYNDFLVKSLGIEKEYPFKKVMFVILFEHTVPTDKDVILNDQYVTEIYSSVDLGWKEPTSNDTIFKFVTDNNSITVGNAIKQITEWCYNNNIEP